MQNLIYGKHAVVRFLENYPNMVIKVYTSHAKDLLASGLVDEPQVTSSTNDKLAKMFNEPVNHQGYVASVKEFNYTPFKEMLNELAVLPTAGVLILDQIHDPYNFGAMIRSALLNNVKHIIILERKQVPVNATVVKTSAGTVYGAKIAKVTNLNQAMKELQNLGF
jgi:23S rRNA (guanosine2251-2'-O)-methyltransferase